MYEYEREEFMREYNKDFDNAEAELKDIEKALEAVKAGDFATAKAIMHGVTNEIWDTVADADMVEEIEAEREAREELLNAYDPDGAWASELAEIKEYRAYVREVRGY